VWQGKATMGKADTPCEARQPGEAPGAHAVIVAQAALVAGLAAWVLVFRLDLGWGREWAIRVHIWDPVVSLVPAAAVVLGCGTLAAYLWRLMRREPGERARRLLAWATVLTLTVGAFGLQISLWQITPGSVPRLVAVQLSRVSAGYLAEAYRVDDLSRYLRDYAREMPSKPEHVATHPPGAVLWFYLIRRAGELMPGLNRAAMTTACSASGLTLPRLARAVGAYPTATWQGADALATALIASGALAAGGCLMVPVLFATLRGQIGDERALAAAAAMALVPSMLLHFPALDELIALLGALMMAALVAATRRPALALLAGLIAAAALFVSLGALALVALGGFFLLLSAGRRIDTQHRTSLWTPALFVLGLLLGLAAWQSVGVDVVQVFAQGLSAHSSITGRAFSRTYGVWVWLNFIEFGVFLGLPLAAMIVASVPRMLRDLRGGPVAALPSHLGAAAVLTILLLDLSGVVKGETGRLWLFFAPYLCAAAAPSLIGERGGRQIPLIATCALTGVQLLLMGLTMQPIVRPY
jgi:hypothetical protein